MTNFLRLQLKDQQKGSIFFTALRQARRFEVEEKKSTYKWGFPDYKLYPSAFTFTMCPVEYISKLEEWSGIEDLTALAKVKRGSAVHKELQNDLLKSRSLFTKPEILEDERIQKKLQAGWPEVPFHDHEVGVSGSADCVLTYKANPLPTEIKTTSIDVYKWEKLTKPHANHECQVSIYAYMFMKMNYYPGTKIENFLIVYLNLLYPPGDTKAEKEFLLPYDHEKTELLINNLKEARDAYIAGTVYECKYPLCSKHGE